MIFKLAWRNLFRNTRRTLLSGLAIGIGLAALIFSDAAMLGMTDNMIRTATATFPGQAQIHKLGFRKTYEVADTIAGSGQMMKELDADPLVQSFSPRVVSFAMLTSPSDVGSVMLYGVDPAREAEVSSLAKSLLQGTYLNLAEPNQILIGQALAKNLSVGVGDRVVITQAQAGTGELSQEMFRVGGVFSFKVREMDSGMAFITLPKAQQLLGIGAGIHEIALSFTDIKLSSDETLPFWKHYSQNGNETLSWGALFPDLKSMVQMTDFALLISALILFGIVSFGIMNTLFMSLYERMFEFGVLRAVGTRPFQLGLMVVLEACSLAIISIVIGMVLGWLLSYVFTVVGIDYRGLDFSNVTIKSLIYPVITWRQYIEYPVWLFLFTTLVGLYPGFYAARMNPARAMKRAM